MAFLQSLSKRLVLRIAACVLALSVISTVVLMARPNLRKRKIAISRPAVNYPPFHNPEHLHHPNPHFKAAYVTMTKGDAGSLANLRLTIRQLEDSVNHQRHYPYIIFSNEPLSTEFKTLARSLSSGDMAFYDKLDSTYYGYSPSTNLTKAAEARERMNGSVLFGESEDYRFASRFMAGTIFRHPALQELDYYWRFETGTEYMCPLAFDPFQYMYDHGKKLSFSIALYEYGDTIPTLFETIMGFAARHPDWVQSTASKNSIWPFVLDDKKTFNMCHFWSNFQIADLSFFRSEAYQAYFDYLDNSNGFFYERWGDPIVLSMAAVLFLEKEQVHFWDDIGYRVAGYFTHCPADYKQCSCRPHENFDNDGYSCLSKFQ
ncbi:hypothetical protein O0I10_000286 [Lichtheimia ornata]|uniref:Glycosyltransferase family 15 protein n=1 Tax=Lichtheimia ornata TaxID=688661 RepID=A0AAD7Y597_9FUNG|nr:uncharacterized protein O0I10_000286 [Lichtheimia ornata]KAJ8664009.1 hypothetical protein O0I10_000286 [Lichtheimia ornata]